MKRGRVKFLTAAFLSIQLMAVISTVQSAEARTRARRSGNVSSPNSEVSRTATRELPSQLLPTDDNNVFEKYAATKSGILLSGRNWDVMRPAGPAVSIDRLLSNVRVTTNCRASLVGHLIKDAYIRVTDMKGFSANLFTAPGTIQAWIRDRAQISYADGCVAYRGHSKPGPFFTTPVVSAGTWTVDDSTPNSSSASEESVGLENDAIPASRFPLPDWK